VRTLVHTLLIVVAAAFAPGAHADFYIVVQASNPQRALTQRQALDLFMGRSRAFSNGDFALLFDLPRDSPKHIAFYRALTGMSPAQVNSYWSRLMFSGQVMPPQPLPDEATMINIVKHNSNAVGWLNSEPTDKALRTLLVIRESP
jgi:hypothetical protein